jgi:hypothetical protein
LLGYGLAEADISNRKFFPLTALDAFGAYFNSNEGRKILTTSGDFAAYWLRSPDIHFKNRVITVSSVSGNVETLDSHQVHGFRPAGILDLNKVVLTEKVKYQNPKGGEVPNSRWTGNGYTARDGDKKLILLDEYAKMPEIKNLNGGTLNNGDTIRMAYGGMLGLSRSAGSSGDKFGYKVQNAAGKVVAAGESSDTNPNVLPVPMKNNFWNFNSASNFDSGASYKLYIYRLMPKSNTSDTASAPIIVNLEIENTTPVITYEPAFTIQHTGFTFTAKGENFPA